jgi:hypothetical protein
VKGDFKYILLLFTVVLLAGCEKKPTPIPPRIDNDPKVLIMYDNIGTWFNDDVAEAERAVAAGALADEGHRVIVFHRKSDGSQIYELVRDKSVKEGFRAKVLKQYAQGEMATLSPEIINSVIGEIRDLTPEANHYGLAFGSHGMGWIPKINSVGLRRSAEPDPFASLWEMPENDMTRFLADSQNEKIDVSEFADALDDWEWDFILFDDCFMASVEALYEIRYLADYFIASPTEIMDKGFPYDRVVERLFRDDWTNLAGVAADFVAYYRNYDIPSGTVSVIKADKLEPLMQSVRAIRLGGLDIIDPDARGIQSYENLSRHVFFDLDDYIQNAMQSPQNIALYSDFRDKLHKAVVFEAHTDSFFSRLAGHGSYNLPITTASGLSTFIPWTKTAPLQPYYQQTEWYKDIYE